MGKKNILISPLLGDKNMKKILLIVSAVILLSGCSQKKEYDPCTGNKSLSLKGNCECACKKMEYEFLINRYSPGGLFNKNTDNCFCKSGSEIKQIY